jgi:hypothetical protein
MTKDGSPRTRAGGDGAIQNSACGALANCPEGVANCICHEGNRLAFGTCGDLECATYFLAWGRDADAA